MNVYTAIFLGVIFLGFMVIVAKYSAKYSKIDHQYGKPYKARLVKLVGTHPELRSGIYSIAFHPNGAISLNQRVVRYSEIKTLEIIERVEKGEHNRHYLVLLVQDDYGENQLYLTSKTKFVEIANELQRAWRRNAMG